MGTVFFSETLVSTYNPEDDIVILTTMRTNDRMINVQGTEKDMEGSGRGLI
jgi:hypothetical protein